MPSSHLILCRPLSRYSVSGQVPREELEVETVLGTLDAPQKIPRHPGLPGEL